MAPRFKSLFSSWSSSTIPDNLPRGRSYEPPISSADYLPSAERKPQPVQQYERPKTAPQSQSSYPQSPRAHPSAGNGNNGASERTRSGFSTKSPPAFLAASKKDGAAPTTTRRRNSIWSIRTADVPPPLPTAAVPPLPMSPAVKGFAASLASSTISPPPSPLSPSARASPTAYVDILTARSTINAAKSKSTPLVVRNYGEDIADRNIANFGAGSGQKPEAARPSPRHLDLARNGDAMRNGNGNEGVPNDAPPSPRATSIRSFTAPRPGIAYPPRSDSLRSGSDHTAGSQSGDERGIPSIVVHDQRTHPISPLASPLVATFTEPQAQAAKSPLAGPTRTAPPPPVPGRSRQRSSSGATASSSHPPVALSRSGNLSRQTSTSSSQPDFPTHVGSPKQKTLSRQTSTSSSQYNMADPHGGSPMKRSPSLLAAQRSSISLSIASQDDLRPATSGGIYHRMSPSSSNLSFTTADGGANSGTVSPHGRSRHTPSPSTASAAERKRASSRSGSVSYSAFPSMAPREHRTSDSFSARRRSGSRMREQMGSPSQAAASREDTADSRSNSFSTTRRSSSRMRDRIGSPTQVMRRDEAAEARSDSFSTRRSGSRMQDQMGSRGIPDHTHMASREDVAEGRSDSFSTRRRSNSRMRDQMGTRGAPELTPRGDNMVETHVTTKMLPGVEHEHVISSKHIIQQELVTVETHHHEVHHRVLPVVSTTILPTKHYLQSEDGKTVTEIPESQIPKHSIHGEIQNWHIPSVPGPSQRRTEPLPAAVSPQEGAAPPIIGLARGEPQNRPRAKSAKSVKPSKTTRSRSKSLFEPILASKKERITEAGHPRVDYVWHHPPVMQTADNQTRPIYIGAGIGDLSHHVYSSDEEEDLAGAKFGAEGGLLFNESEYELSGTLPGLVEQRSYEKPYKIEDPGFITSSMNRMRM